GAVVAHDLRQPVGTISLAAELLLKRHAGEVPDMERRALERIRSATQRLSRMISDLSDASQIESKRLSIEPRLVELGALIDSVVDSLDEVTAGYHLRAVVGAEQQAWIDPDRIHQVLGNLVSNAAKYGSPGTEIRIDVDTRDDLVEVIVTNHGP